MLQKRKIFTTKLMKIEANGLEAIGSERYMS